METHALIVRNLESQMREEQSDLPIEWFDVLIHLSEASDGRMRMSDIGGTLALIPSNITRLVDRMEDAALVKREPCPEDRRVTYAVITQEGREMLRQTIPDYRRRVEGIFMQHLTDDDVRALNSALSKVYKANKS